MKSLSCFLSLVMVLILSTKLVGDVSSASANGFEIKITKTVSANSADSYQIIVEDFNKWWDAAHSVSGKAENLSIDFEKGCFLEQLPDGGFVRHLEIVRHIPGTQLRMVGGLGPLQGMAVHGAFTIDLKSVEGKQGTVIELSYNVTGYTNGGLKPIANPVNRVLSEQMDRLEKLINNK